MPKIAKELSASDVAQLNVVGFHAVGGVSGLGLQVFATGSRSWVLRTTVNKKRRKLGLGGYPETTLESAREKALDRKRRIDLMGVPGYVEGSGKHQSNEVLLAGEDSEVVIAWISRNSMKKLEKASQEKKSEITIRCGELSALRTIPLFVGRKINQRSA